MHVENVQPVRQSPGVFVARGHMYMNIVCYSIRDVQCLLQKQMLPTPPSKKRSVPSICPGHLQVRSHLGSQPHVLGNHAGVRNSGSLNHPDQSCNW